MAASRFLWLLYFGRSGDANGRESRGNNIEEIPRFRGHLSRLGVCEEWQVAKDVDLTETALRDWIKRAEVDAGGEPKSELTSSGREELAEMRRRVKRLEMEREILEKEAGFFAKENA